MNKPIRTMAVGCLVMFVALLLNATYLQYVNAGALNDRNDNRRVLDEQFSRKRGAIIVAGRPVAISTPSDDKYKYQRSYTAPMKYAHTTGFFSYLYGTTGVERTQNRILSGSDPRLFGNRVVDLIRNSQLKGGSVTLTLDPAAQQAALDGLLANGPHTQGAVVAIEPATGRILALVSTPSFDPNLLAGHDLTKVKKSWDALLADPDNPMLNRASSEIYPPGSTFKLVTSAAALESGDYNPQTLVKGGTRLDLPLTDKDLVNENGSGCGGDPITLTQALVVSCNVSFGSIGLDLGDDALREQSRKFGWGQRYLTDLPNQAISRFPPNPDQPQTALSAIGQYNVAASPLQMALVAATIANNGQGMVPYLVDEVRAPDLTVLGKTRDKPMPERAMSAIHARELTGMMVEVVERGTGANAKIPGYTIAGKTGTAQSAKDRPPYAWFVCFGPANDAQVAVAVLIEDAGVERDAISGGGLAAPIAKRVMEAVILK